jgi:ABC-2 type transport system permease protein
MTRAFWVLLRRELGALLLSPIAYVLLLCMALVNGFDFLLSVNVLAQGGAKGWTVTQIYFSMVHFWFCLVILVPVLTMRLFSEEYKAGTIEPLVTAPVQDWDIVLSKFFSAWIIYALLWLPTVLAVVIFQIISKGQMPLAWGTLILSLTFVLVVGAFYTSIGMLCSSLTKNQAISAFICFTSIALLFFIGFLTFAIRDSWLRNIFYYIFTYQQMTEFAKGFFDSRPIVFYLSSAILLLVLTQRVLVTRRLKV